MGGLAGSLASAAVAAGATIRCDTEVDSILITGGRAAGVRLKGGEEIRSTVVLSNADLRATMALVDAELVDRKTSRETGAYEFRGSMARVFYALDGCSPTPA